MIKDARGWLAASTGWIWPGQSLISKSPLPSGGYLTPEEFETLSFMSKPHCEICAYPFEHDEGEGAICGACAARRPLFGRARAALQYSDAVAEMILSLKRQGQRSGLSFFADIMSKAGKPLIDEADLILPVPLHYQRLVSRGFNQAGWLAEAVAKSHRVPLYHDLIIRKKASKSQGQLSPRQRRANVAGAFALTAAGKQKLNGKRVLLIDDVFTTGATLEACIRAMKPAKPAMADVLTLARVVTAKKAPI